MTIPAAIVALVGAGVGPHPPYRPSAHDKRSVLVEAPQKKFALVSE